MKAGRIEVLQGAESGEMGCWGMGLPVGSLETWSQGQWPLFFKGISREFP